ncbi:MAG: hypothetical protein JO166_05120 [Deltaproteobacteria bacterium]|nr:hypothetical protein [Deltaproteobacteria bacterium]
MKDLVIAPKDPPPVRQRREVERTIEHWLRHTSGDGNVPCLLAFDFASIKADWSHRFLICTEQNAEDAAFVAYGADFATLLGLPETVTSIVPLYQQIPERYRPLFAEGCTNALTQGEPARFSGAFEHYFTAELFRAVFLPIRMNQGWSKWLVFGSFNCRTVLTTEKKGS